MKASEILSGFKVFAAKVKITQPHTVFTDVTVFAKDAYMARQQLKQQYGVKSLISNVREIK
jgi:hypothetical protein